MHVPGLDSIAQLPPLSGGTAAGVATLDRQITQLSELMRVARVAQDRAERTVARSTCLVLSARRGCGRARARRSAGHLDRLYAELEGHLDGQPVHAIVYTDGVTHADSRLLDRADILVRLGELFGDDGQVEASLDHTPLAATLTLMRACDRVTSLRMGTSHTQP